MTRGMVYHYAAPASRRQVSECAGLTVIANPFARHRCGLGSSITYQWCASSLSSYEQHGQHESRLQFEDVSKEREEYLAKVNHLQEAVRTHFSALTSLKQHAAQLRLAVDEHVGQRADPAGARGHAVPGQGQG